MGFQETILQQVESALPPLGDPVRAAGAQKYMKDIAPFLGVTTDARRKVLRPIFRSAPTPSSNAIGRAAAALMALPEREFHYAAYDLIEHFNKYADEDFLAAHGERLLTTKSWWDTVDGLGTAMVSPLTLRYPSRALMRRWNRSDNIWLVRASIQHQRGRRAETEIDYVLSLCHPHAASREFFIAKAIGWALRDISKSEPDAVREFLRAHPELSTVAVREAVRHLPEVDEQ